MIAQERKEAVYREYYPKIHRYITGKVGNPQEAEDLVSDVFLKVCQHWDTFDESKASVSTWVYTIARNAVIDFYRTHRSHAELPETLTATGSMEDDLTQRDMLSSLSTALEALEQRQRDIIILRYWKGMTLKDIAARMELSYTYIKVLHNEALRKLRRHLEP